MDEPRARREQIPAGLSIRAAIWNSMPDSAKRKDTVVHATFQSAISPLWTTMEPIRLGAVLPWLGTPDTYVLVEKDGQPYLRIDVHSSRDAEVHCFQDVQLWQEYVVVGYGECVYLVSLRDKAAHAIHLGDYFGYLYLGQSYLLVASARQILRIAPTGEILWQTEDLGLDGVVVQQIEDSLVHGQGEWDPPGGWKSFVIHLDSGQRIR